MIFAEDREVVGWRESRAPHGQTLYPKQPSRKTLEGIARALLEDGHDQSGVQALLLPEPSDAEGDLAAELPVPTLEPGHQALQKIRRLLRQDGLVHGILVLKIRKPSDDDEGCEEYDEMEIEDI